MHVGKQVIARMIQNSWLLEDEAQLLNLLEALNNKFTVSDSSQTTHRITYLDTFDWRIWRKGDVLEYHESDKQKKLIWRTIDYRLVHVEIPVDECPDFINDIPGWLRPEPLAETTWPRALVQQVMSRTGQQTYELRDSADKVVCRLVIIREVLRHSNNRSGDALADRLQIDVMRGYEKEFRRVEKIIHKIGLDVYGRDPLVKLLNQRDRRPCDYSHNLRLQLHPNQRADVAAKQIMLQLIQMMEANESGIKEDLDIEYLKDYRYAIQRANSLVKQLKQVIPEDTRKRFSKELQWIDTETSRLQELNLWLLDFESHRQQIESDLRPNLDELHEWLFRQRHVELLKVVKLFETEHYKKFMKRWRVYLECAVPDHSVLKRAEKPVLKVAGRQIWKAYKKLAGHEDAFVMHILQSDLVEMGRTSSTLYDLLTLSRTLFPDASIATLSTALQSFRVALENCLEKQGEAQALRGFMLAMKKAGLKDKKSALAMDMLLERIMEKHTDCLSELQLAYVRIAHADMHNTYERLFKKS